MRLLLISNSTNYKEPYLAWCQTQIILFCQQNNIRTNSKLIFVPFAGVKMKDDVVYPKSYDVYLERVQVVFKTMGFENVQSILDLNSKPKDLQDADCIIVGGGNTFHLVAELHKYDLMNAIASKVKAGTPYIGWSAGSNIACPTLCTTNDMPIVQPKSFDTLNLVPFQINPHYIDPYPETVNDMLKHGGESRMDRLNEYMAVNQKMTVVGLREASALWVEDGEIKLRGSKPMVIFQYGKEPREIVPEADATHLLLCK